MGDAAALRHCGFVGGNIEALVELDFVGVDDFGREV